MSVESDTQSERILGNSPGDPPGAASGAAPGGAPVKPQEVIAGSPNYNRLSAMIESLSLHGSLDDDAYMPSRKNSPVDDNDNDNDNDNDDKSSSKTSGSKSAQFTDPTQSIGLTKTISLETPDSGYMQLHNMSPGNRESMLSTYSGTVHEGVPVSYVVQKQKQGQGSGDGGESGGDGAMVRKEVMMTSEPSLPPLPSKKVWSPVEVKSVKPLVISASSQEAEVLGLDPDLSPSPGPGLGPGPGSSPGPGKSNSLKLLSMDRGMHQKVPSSIASGNLASESGHSHNMSTTSNSGSSTLPHLSELDEPYDDDQQTHHSAMTNTTPLDISDHDHDQGQERAVSMSSSVIPPLETQVHPNRARGLEPDRELISDVLPPVPPRSTKRPKSHIFIKESLDDIQNQLAKEMLDPARGPCHIESYSYSHADSHAGSHAASVRSDSFFSATELDNGDDNGDEDERYTTRPLPSIPTPDQQQFTTPEAQTQAQAGSDETLGHEHEQVQQENDDDYEDIIEDTPQNRVRTPQSRLPKTPSARPKPKTRPNSKPSSKAQAKTKKELRSFDIDTISQLLNVTKGTLIGSEFSNLGMKLEEKRALEKLVDSLSRLTADMVLDPEKFHEGLRRLERATKALDGF